MRNIHTGWPGCRGNFIGPTRSATILCDYDLQYLALGASYLSDACILDEINTAHPHFNSGPRVGGIRQASLGGLVDPPSAANFLADASVNVDNNVGCTCRCQ